MIRVSKHLRDLLKIKAKAEGRTLEWAADEALKRYVVSDDVKLAYPEKVNMKNAEGKYPWEDESVQDTDQRLNGDVLRERIKPYQSGGLTYKPVEDWGA